MVLLPLATADQPGPLPVVLICATHEISSRNPHLLCPLCAREAREAAYAAQKANDPNMALRSERGMQSAATRKQRREANHYGKR